MDSYGVLGIVELFTSPELRYTFGVEKQSDVPPHLEIDPKLTYSQDGSLTVVEFKVRVAIKSNIVNAPDHL
nr:unnamed protein product [Haemonchus contortus]